MGRGIDRGRRFFLDIIGNLSVIAIIFAMFPMLPPKEMRRDALLDYRSKPATNTSGFNACTARSTIVNPARYAGQTDRTLDMGFDTNDYRGIPYVKKWSSGQEYCVPRTLQSINHL